MSCRVEKVTHVAGLLWTMPTIPGLRRSRTNTGHPSPPRSIFGSVRIFSLLTCVLEWPYNPSYPPGNFFYNEALALCLSARTLSWDIKFNCKMLGRLKPLFMERALPVISWHRSTARQLLMYYYQRDVTSWQNAPICQTGICGDSRWQSLQCCVARPRPP